MGCTVPHEPEPGAVEMKTWRASAVSVAALLAGCQMAARSVKPPPLDAEGEVWVYLQELPSQAERLEFSLESLAATRADGQEFPLRLALAEVSGKDERRQRLLATGRLPPGEYTGLSLRVKKATLAGDDGGAPANLLVPAEPVKVAARFAVARARARVVTLALQYGHSLDKGFGFRPAFPGAVPAMPLVELLGFATATGSDAVTVFDKQSRQVVAVLAAGRDPKGLAVDRLQGKLYVALSGADEVAAYDLVTGEELGRARLQPGDRPQELGALRRPAHARRHQPGQQHAWPSSTPQGARRGGARPDGHPAHGAPHGPAGAARLRLQPGLEQHHHRRRGDRAPRPGPSPPTGRPARGAFNRAGDRMYVVSPTSAYMDVLAIPSLARVNQIYVGFNAVGVHVDPRTDYVYVSMGDGGQLQLFAPLAPLPVGRVELPGPATFLAIDNAYDRMLGVVPDRNGVVRHGAHEPEGAAARRHRRVALRAWRWSGSGTERSRWAAPPATSQARWRWPRSSSPPPRRSADGIGATAEVSYSSGTSTTTDAAGRSSTIDSMLGPAAVPALPRQAVLPVPRPERLRALPVDPGLGHAATGWRPPPTPSAGTSSRARWSGPPILNATPYYLRRQEFGTVGAGGDVRCAPPRSSTRPTASTPGGTRRASRSSPCRWGGTRTSTLGSDVPGQRRRPASSPASPTWR